MFERDVPDIRQQLDRATAAFEQRFGRPPRFAAAAPGRVNLIGEHTDYNDGFVLPMAIERAAVFVADPTDADRATVASTAYDEPARFPVDRSLEPGDPPWANYVTGVVAGFVRRGLDVPAFDAVVDSTVPLGGGLSSSAALEVGMATLLEAMLGEALPPADKALLCQQAEHEFAGVPCGIMDQFISAFAETDHAMLLDCRSHETQMAPLRDPEVVVLVVNTNVKHELTGGEYAERRSQCEAAAQALGVKALRDATMKQLQAAKTKLDPVAFRRARHVIGENQRTLEAADRMANADWPAFGELMYQSHASLRDLFEVSCGELDLLVDLARQVGPDGGVIGSRMTGGGFGGCTVSLVRASEAERIAEHLCTTYTDRTAIRPAAFLTRAAEGARTLTL